MADNGKAIEVVVPADGVDAEQRTRSIGGLQRVPEEVGVETFFDPEREKSELRAEISRRFVNVLLGLTVSIVMSALSLFVLDAVGAITMRDPVLKADINIISVSGGILSMFSAFFIGFRNWLFPSSK